MPISYQDNPYKYLHNIEGDFKMNFSTAAFLFDDNVKAVKVSYEQGDKGTIFKTTDKDLKVDDLVVISTNTRYNYTVGKVVEVDSEIDFNTTSQIGWVVSRVDIDAYEQLKTNEQAAIKQIRELEIAQKKQQLRSAMTFGNEGAVSFNLLAAPTKDAAA